MTKIIEKFLEKVKKVGLCYQQSKFDKNASTESRLDLRSRLWNYTLWLESAIENIHKSKDEAKTVQRVQDIYVHAIPRMVFLLKNTLAAQSTLYAGDEEIQSLKHVLNVQELVLQLCKKAQSWSESNENVAKSLRTTDLPIKGATTRKILPYLRDIGEALRIELQSLREEARRAKDESARLEMYHAREAMWQQKRERNRKEREKKQQQAAEDALRLLGQPLLYSSRPNPPKSSDLDQWTEDQDHELLRLLWDLGDLPGMQLCSASSYTFSCLSAKAERRYLIVLNSPLLQNKLPEHIKSRALMLKPAMESDFRQSGLCIPQWVNSIV